MPHIRRLAQFGVAVALVAGVVAPAAAEPPVATRGSFSTLPGGVERGYDVEGAAVMVRLPFAGGRTLVFVHLRGLEPRTTYPVHVHNAACSDTPAGGGHYQHQVGGPVDAENEIWPTVTTNPAGNGVGAAIHAHRAGADAMAIVVHYPEMTSVRLACADLS